MRKRGSYLVGPLARYALNSGVLSDLARAAVAGAGLPDLVRNPFQSIVVRALEILYAFGRLRCEQAIRNFDPCISCATHFVTLEVDRR